MISREALDAYLHEYLACDHFKDYAPNGMQIEGKNEIQRICTAVTASEEVILEAAQRQADALLVHHGYFWRGEDPILIGIKRRRIGHILKHNMSLFAYHLPLDCHTTLGNNICLSQLLMLDNIKSHHVAGTDNILWSGTVPQAMSSAQYTAYLTEKLGRKPLCVSAGTKKIQSIALCSGAAQDYIEDAWALGVDAYISGEISERTYYQAKELNIHYFACGHHATERLGIRALGNYLASQFALEHVFIDSNNPV